MPAYGHMAEFRDVAAEMGHLAVARIMPGWKLEGGCAAVVASAGAIGLGCDWQAVQAKTTAKI
jgi:hypothetical protein